MKSSSKKEIISRKVKLNGLRPILFDRFPGDLKTKFPPEKKMYFAEDGKTLVLPALNIKSFLSAENTMSAPKRVFDPRGYKKIAQGAQSYVDITPELIPFTDGSGKLIQFKGWTDKLHVVCHVARVKGGIPNPVERVCLELPWSLGFQISMVGNVDVNEDDLRRLFEEGGKALGFGTFRTMYGKFEVAVWE